MTEDEFLPADPPTGLTLSRSTSAGLAGLVIGCTLLVSACVLMAFNVLLFVHFFAGRRGLPIGLALVGATIGLSGVAVLGVVAFVLGIRSWSSARAGEARALGVAATLAGLVGLIAWLIASINLMVILLSYRD
jgi:hypothetical protein